MPKVAKNKNPEIVAAQKAMVDELAAVEFWERHRWGNTPACVHCGDVDVYAMRSRTDEREKRFRWRCRGCKGTYTVKVGTVMQGSNIPLQYWTMALHLMTASKKGFAAKQLQRMSGLSYKSALFLAHRVRYAMEDEIPAALTGTIEVDETYVGGRPRKISRAERERAAAEGRGIPRNKRGRGTKKVPVVVMVERGGRAYASPVATVSGENLERAIAAHCHPSARIMTDELVLYKPIAAQFQGGHRTVHHGSDEYVRVEADGFVAHTNTVEGFNSLLKRGIIGIYHSVSVRHLHRYVTEAAWRYSERHCDDGQRMLRLVGRVEGKKLANRKSAAL